MAKKSLYIVWPNFCNEKPFSFLKFDKTQSNARRRGPRVMSHGGVKDSGGRGPEFDSYLRREVSSKQNTRVIQ